VPEWGGGVGARRCFADAALADATLRPALTRALFISNLKQVVQRVSGSMKDLLFLRSDERFVCQPNRSSLASAMKRLRTLDDRQAAIAIAADYFAIAAAVLVAMAVHHWLVTIACLILIAGRQVAFTNLVHAAAHSSLFANRRYNEYFEWLYAYPVLDTIDAYRKPHLEHHAEIARRSGGRYEYLHNELGLLRRGGWGRTWVLFVRPLFGYNTWSFLKGTFLAFCRDRTYRLKISAYWTALAVLSVLSGLQRYLLLYWVLPLLLIYPVLNMWAEVSDHFQARDDLRNQAGLFYGLLLKGHELYHGTHHKYPYIPFYKLADATVLMEQYGESIERVRGPLTFLRCIYRRRES
jgi:fatty acid desaturase